MRNKWFRSAGRKSLKSLSALNQSFLSIVCLQILSRHFVSPFRRMPFLDREPLSNEARTLPFAPLEAAAPTGTDCPRVPECYPGDAAVPLRGVRRWPRNPRLDATQTTLAEVSLKGKAFTNILAKWNQALRLSRPGLRVRASRALSSLPVGLNRFRLPASAGNGELSRPSDAERIPCARPISEWTSARSAPGPAFSIPPGG